MDQIPTSYKYFLKNYLNANRRGLVIISQSITKVSHDMKRKLMKSHTHSK